MPDNIAQLIETLDSRERVCWSGPAFRMHNPVWAWSPLSGEGAKRVGGRFNPKGAAALYLGLTVNTCLAEVSGGISTKLLDPQVLCSYHIDIDALLDLRDCYAMFSGPWRLQLLQGAEPPGWQLYKAIAAVGDIEGILVPSYQTQNASNLILFHWQPQQVVLHDPQNTMAAIYGDKFDGGQAQA